VTAAYIDRKAQVGFVVDIVQVLAWCALGLFLVLLGWQLPPALRRYVDRKGSLHDTRYFPVAWVALPDGRVAPQILYLPNGGNGQHEPPAIHNWTNTQAAPRAPVLKGEVVSEQDITLEKAMRLIQDSIAANGEEGQDVLGWREANMSSGRWQVITNLMARAGLVDKTSTGTRTHGDTKLGDVLYTLEVYPGELYAPTPPEGL